MGLALAAACCGHAPVPTPTENMGMKDVTGTVMLDGVPQRDVELSLVTSDGRTVAAARSGADGAFHAPRGDAAWVVAKLRGPALVGAVVQRLGDGALALDASTARAATVTASMQLPGGVPAVDWYEVSLTPTALDGVPDQVLRTVTLDGMGPARVNALASQRTGSRAELRVVPGQYTLVVTHVVEQPKSPAHEISYVTGGGVIGGQRVAASLDALSIDARHDVAVTVEMVPGGG